MEIKDYQIKGIVQGKLSDFWQAKVKEVFDRNATKLLRELRSTSPVGSTGDLKAGWVLRPARKSAGISQYSVDIANTAPSSFYRIVGRGPGPMPPKQPILDWVHSKGIKGKEAERRAFLIRRKIGKRGTDRWIERDNPLGLRRNGSLSSRSPIVLTQRNIQLELKRLKL